MRNPTPAPLAAPFPADEDPLPAHAEGASKATAWYQVRPLTPIQIDLLLRLARSPAPLSLEDLMRVTRVPRTTLRWLLEPLVQHGLVKRVEPPLPDAQQSRPGVEKEAAR